MPQKLTFLIIYAPEVYDHLAAIDRKHHRNIESKIVEQLTHTPEQETRNRKPLVQPAPFGATWELRLGLQNRFRVFYQVDSEASTVLISAIGVKKREQLLFGNDEVDL